jgi:hypothetical protein
MRWFIGFRNLVARVSAMYLTASPNDICRGLSGFAGTLVAIDHRLIARRW